MNLTGIEKLKPELRVIFERLAPLVAERARKAECQRTHTPYRKPRPENFYQRSSDAVEAAKMLSKRIGQDEEHAILTRETEEERLDRILKDAERSAGMAGATQLTLDV